MTLAVILALLFSGIWAYLFWSLYKIVSSDNESSVADDIHAPEVHHIPSSLVHAKKIDVPARKRISYDNRLSTFENNDILVLNDNYSSR